MTFMFYATATLLLLVLAAGLFTRANPASIANVLRLTLPIILLLTAALSAFLGRGGLAIMLAMGAAAAYRSMRRTQSVNRTTGQKSSVRTAALEMTLDHDTGDLEGVVLAGNREGAELAELSNEDLMVLHTELAGDTESQQLLEAYLDRRMPGWRDGADADPGAGQGAPAGSGTMTKQEAYQILGLEEGASAAAIRKAHRSLMQRVHPDRGGSSFLAARINQAKDILLSGH